MKKPAYIKQFKALNCATFKTAVVFYGSEAWAAKDQPFFSYWGLVIPPLENPLTFDFSVLKDCLVYGCKLGTANRIYREDVAVAVMLGGAHSFKTFTDNPISEERYGNAA